MCCHVWHNNKPHKLHVTSTVTDVVKAEVDVTNRIDSCKIPDGSP